MSRRRWTGALVAACAWSLGACSNVPPESVELSEFVTARIAEARRAHVAVVRELFDRRRRDIDRFIEQTWTPQFVANVREGAGLAAGEPLEDEAVKLVIAKIVERRDAMVADLDRTATLVIDAVDENYDAAQMASTSLTGLLRSAADVDQACSSALAQIQGLTGGEVDVAAISAKLDQYLARAGDASAQGLTMYDEVKGLLGQGGQ